MEEKIIIKSENKNNSIAMGLLIAGIALLIVFFIAQIGEVTHGFSRFKHLRVEYLFAPYKSGIPFFGMIASVVIIIISFIFKAIMSKSELVVTSQRVQGKSNFGKVVDLPVSQISSVGLGWGSRITVGTSSGAVNFWLISNRDEIHKAISQVLSTKNESVAPTTPIMSTSNADELKKYKDLLDSGIITQEEFDAKKKQLLGL